MTFYSIKMRCIGLAALIILTLAVYSGCRNEAPDDPLTKKERAWLAAHDGKIVLGHDPNAYPVDFTTEKGEFRGIAADYVKLLEKRLHFKFKVVHIKTWNEVVAKAKERKIDVLCSFTKNAEREKWMLFTEPYFVIPSVILTRNEDQRDLSLEKMKAMKVTFTKGWVIEDYLKKNIVIWIFYLLSTPRPL